MKRDLGGESVDRPAAVRPGEELDVERLAPYLEGALGVKGECCVRQFPSGYSNLTYLVRIGEDELVLRRPPFGSKPKTGHDMQREHTVLSALHSSFPYCPEPLLFCDDPSVVGSPFYVMRRLEGIIVRRDFPPELSLSPDDVRSLFKRLIDVHVELHSVDFREVGLEDFGRPEGYIERQVRGWSRRYRRARTPDVPDFEEVMAWLGASLPPETGGGSIIHNDFRLDNVVLDADDPMKIIGVLDWEMATLGNPLMDLGASLAYWVDRSDPPEFQALHMMPTIVEGAPTRAEMVARYAERSGRAIDDFNFYYCYGLFRLAAIVQQIYYRSYHGQTDDSRFRGLNQWVGALAGAAGRLI